MLANCLTAFQTSVNENQKLKKFLKGWEPVIIISSTDTEKSYSLVVKDESVAEILPEKINHQHQIEVEGEETTLEQVFSGSLNPASALLDGQIAVYGSDKDQLKLDAIAFIIWGM